MTLPITTEPYDLYEHGPVNLARWVKGDGTDETEAFNAAADAARSTNSSWRGLFMPEYLKVRVDGIVNLRIIHNLDLQGTIVVGPEGRVDVGHKAPLRFGSRINIRRVEQASRATQANAVLRTVGLKAAQVWVQYCDHWEWWADGGIVDDASSSYCSVYPGQIRQLDLLCQPGADGTIGWITEVAFFGGDFKKINIDGNGYNINSVTFFKPCLENALDQAEVRINWASRVRFVDARCEYGTPFWFGDRTSRIVVEDSFITNDWTVSPAAKVMEDLGIENVVTSSFEQYYQRSELASITSDMLPPSEVRGTHLSGVKRGLGGIDITAPSQVILDTGLIPLSGGSSGHPTGGSWRMPRLVFSSDAKSFRPRLTFFDKNKVQISDQGMVQAGGLASWNTESHRYQFNVDTDFMMAVATDQSVAYMRMEIVTGPTVVAFERLEIIGYFLGGSSTFPRSLVQARMENDLRAATSNVVTWKKETTLSAATSAGASISVTDAAGVFRGITAGVLLEDGRTHTGEVVGIGGAGGRTLEVSPQLPLAATAGARVIFIRYEELWGTGQLVGDTYERISG